MLLQRLIEDPTVGFNYDYMGSFEFEEGAATAGRTGIAQAYEDNDLTNLAVNLVEHWGVSTFDPVPVVVIARKADIDYIRNSLIDGRLDLAPSKERMRTDDPKIIGWMKVGRPFGETVENPLFIVRQSLVDRGPRFEKFINPAIEYLKSQAA